MPTASRKEVATPVARDPAQKSGSAKPVLFYLPISHYCVSVERMMAFKGIPCEIVKVPYHDKRELIRATGQDFVPALVWGTQIVPWKEIPEFLEERKPEPTLFPAQWKGVAEVLENWGHLVLEERVWRAVVTKVPPTLGDLERWVFEEIQTRARGPWHVLELREAEFRLEMIEYLRLVDAMLRDKEWVLGQPSVADFGLYGGLSPLLTIGEEIPAGLPSLTKWVQQIRRLRVPKP
ncbi:MAG: glutathione S-transferase family protein [Thermoplasmata archaeon]